VLEQHPNSTCAKIPGAKFDAEAPFQPCKNEHSKREARVSTDIKAYVCITGLTIAPRRSPKGIWRWEITETATIGFYMPALVDPFALKYGLTSNASLSWQQYGGVFFPSLQREMSADTHVNGI
jgi:hypothetical protein